MKTKLSLAISTFALCVSVLCACFNGVMFQHSYKELKEIQCSYVEQVRGVKQSREQLCNLSPNDSECKKLDADAKLLSDVESEFPHCKALNAQALSYENQPQDERRFEQRRGATNTNALVSEASTSPNLIARPSRASAQPLRACCSRLAR